MVETRRLTELVDSALERLRLPEGDLAVALSGGADSAALAFLCQKAGRQPRALHVNHGLTHSGRLEEAAVSVADSLGLELEVRRISVPEGASPEGQARQERYRAFTESTREGESLLTAHTLDDNAETILANLIRGSGARGLSGIPYWRPAAVYRPILSVSRSETREIAALADLAFHDDPMNDDPALTRNWLRLEILPRLRGMNPQIADSLQRTAASLARDVDYLEGLAASEAPELAEAAARHPVSRLLIAPRPVADRVLMLMLSQTIGRSSVTADRIDRIWSVVRGEAASQQLGKGSVARVEGPLLIVERPADRTQEPASVELVPGVNRAGRLIFEVREAEGVCRVLPLSKWSAVFPKDTVLVAGDDGVVAAEGEPAWIPGEKRLPVAWYRAGDNGYLSVLAREGTGWTSSH